MNFQLPPSTTKESGETRRVGFEIEFTGLTINEVTQILLNVLGGKLQEKSSVEHVLDTPQYGEFKAELDWEFLKNAAKDAQVKDGEPEWLDFVYQLALSVVPIEVVSPPFFLDKLEKLDEIIPALRNKGAKGTDDSVVAAFGVHINPELPSLDVNTVHAYMRAFALLQWWLSDAHQVDLSRKISPYIQLYSEEYVELLVGKTYQKMDDLIDDYLAHNPSRNRALDMLPLFAYLDEGRVQNVVSDTKVNKRPTLHYRLPNCLIEDRDWSFATSWNIWCKVEELAVDLQSIDTLSSRFRELSLPVLGVTRGLWIKEIEQWIASQESA